MLMINNFSICYVIRESANTPSHFLRGSIFSNETIEAFKLISRLPINIPELLCTREETIRTRLDSIYHGRVIELISNHDQIPSLPYIFKVVFLDTAPPENHYMSNDILYISLNKDLANQAAPHIETLTTEVLRDFFFSKIQNKDPILRKLPDTYQIRKPIKVDFKITNNIYTYANIQTLNSVGIITEDTGKVTLAENDKTQNTENLIDIINHYRRAINSNLPSCAHFPSMDYLITDFSIDFEYSINSNKYSKHTLLRSGVPDHALIAESVTHARATTEIDTIPENKLILDYQSEQYFSSLINSLYAASTLTPEIKIDICNNDLMKIISSMRDHVGNKSSAKIHKLASDFSETVLSKSNALLDYISYSLNKQIKIISNFPLEWTNLNGLPLMIRHNTSRVFTSPGIIREKLTLNNHECKLTIEDFNKILVISSFPADDDISADMSQELEKTVNLFNDPRYKALTEHLAKNEIYTTNFESEIIFEVVKNKNELIQSLNKHRYAIVVFDMHGGHGKDGHGFLQLSEGIIYPQDLINNAQIPPIVILSSCDTSPADRNHFNVANAFLCAGAKTVLASTYTILSSEAANYIAKLYKRIKLYLPERILSEKRSLRWSDFMTGLNRRVYFESFLIHISKKYKVVSKKQINEIGSHISSVLEAHPDNFYEGVLFFFNEIAGLSNELILDELTNHFTFTECMNYVQIGFPEKILIHAEDMSFTEHA